MIKLVLIFGLPESTLGLMTPKVEPSVNGVEDIITERRLGWFFSCSNLYDREDLGVNQYITL